MPHTVQIPGVGTETFPDDATPDEIEAALNQKYPPPPQPPPSTTSATEAAVKETSLFSRAVKGVGQAVGKMAEEFAPLAVGDVTPLVNMVVPNKQDIQAFTPSALGQRTKIGSPEYFEQVTNYAVPLATLGVPLFRGKAGEIPRGGEIPDASQITSTTGAPERPIRTQVGEEAPLRQQGETPQAQPQEEVVPEGYVRFPDGRIIKARDDSGNLTNEYKSAAASEVRKATATQGVLQVQPTESEVIPSEDQGSQTSGEGQRGETGPPEEETKGGVLSPELQSEFERVSRLSVEDGLSPPTLEEFRGGIQSELDQVTGGGTQPVPKKWAAWEAKRRGHIAELDKVIKPTEEVIPSEDQRSQTSGQGQRGETGPQQPGDQRQGGKEALISDSEYKHLTRKAKAGYTLTDIERQQVLSYENPAAAEPTPAAALPEIPPEDVKYTGVANRVYDRLTEEGQLGEVPTGAGRSTSDSIAIGRRRLSEGANPDEIASRFWKTRRISDNEFAVLRAHSENLHGMSLAAEKAMKANPTPENTAKFEQAFQDFHDFSRNVIQPAKTATSNIFRAMQDEEPLHVDSYTGMREALNREKGRDITPQERPIFEKAADAVQTATRARNGEAAQIDTALKKAAPRSRRVVTNDDLRGHIAELMKKRFPCQ